MSSSKLAGRAGQPLETTIDLDPLFPHTANDPDGTVLIQEVLIEEAELLRDATRERSVDREVFDTSDTYGVLRVDQFLQIMRDLMGS